MKTEPNEECEKAWNNYCPCGEDSEHAAFRAGWAARGKREGPATEKTAEPAHTSGFSQPDWSSYTGVPMPEPGAPLHIPAFTYIGATTPPTETFSDRLNALTKTLEAVQFTTIQIQQWVDSAEEGTTRTPRPEILQGNIDATAAILAAIARECGGAK